MKQNNIKHYIEKKYRNLQSSFLRVDILIFCCYILKQQKRNKIKMYDVWRNLAYYDYYYYTKYKSIQMEMKILFPLYKNNRKRNKYFKISKVLVDYWGQKFEIEYKQHEGIYSVFKSLDHEK
ncbi:MAG: hypothetical protein LBR10_11105 [Prevotellaceae bacterium]|jgi:hypothetical protein|nr:hypothetical protein [Prevotellaceae bacterium]